MGTQYGTQKIYEAYALKPESSKDQCDSRGDNENRDIHAIYKFFSIDSEWWDTRTWDDYRAH